MLANFESLELTLTGSEISVSPYFLKSYRLANEDSFQLSGRKKPQATANATDQTLILNAFKALFLMIRNSNERTPSVLYPPFLRFRKFDAVSIASQLTSLFVICLGIFLRIAVFICIFVAVLVFIFPVKSWERLPGYVILVYPVAAFG